MIITGLGRLNQIPPIRISQDLPKGDSLNNGVVLLIVRSNSLEKLELFSSALKELGMILSFTRSVSPRTAATTKRLVGYLLGMLDKWRTTKKYLNLSLSSSKGGGCVRVSAG